MDLQAHNAVRKEYRLTREQLTYSRQLLLQSCSNQAKHQAMDLMVHGRKSRLHEDLVYPRMQGPVLCGSALSALILDSLAEVAATDSDLVRRNWSAVLQKRTTMKATWQLIAMTERQQQH